MKPIEPMEPVSSENIPEESDWTAQVKWDGVRILVYRENGVTRLFNRKRNERTINYPELADSASYCKAESVILDGEMIALGSDGKPSFHEVMRRDGVRRKEKLRHAHEEVPITYMIFDVLYFNGEWINQRPFANRTELLQSIIVPNESVQLVRCHDDGEELFQAIKKNGMEGIVLKRKSSVYLFGQKKEWLKVKNYKDLIAAIGGFTLNNGIVNALLLGQYDPEGRFLYIGHSGTGKLSALEWRELTSVLMPRAVREIPFANKPDRSKGAYWVKPEFTVKVKYAEWTAGEVLRQPSIEGFVQTAPKSCVIEKGKLR